MNEVKKHFNEVAADYDYYKRKNKYYYDNLKKLLRSLIPPQKRVFEIGCGTGDLIAAVKPTRGYGMDISPEMIHIAKNKYDKLKDLAFSTIWPTGKAGRFDYIFMSDVIEHLENPGDLFKETVKLMDKNTVFVNTMANPLWEPILMFWEKMGWKMPEGPHNRISFKELEKMINECGLKIIKHDYKLLFPINIPFVSGFVNKYLEKYLKKYAFIEFIITVKK